MKNFSRKLSLFLGLIVFVFSININAQQKANYITLNYILSKLTFTSRINHTNEEINNKLIKEIQERKVDFFLTDEREKSIKEARGTDFLIKVIRENTPKSIEEEEKIKEIVRIAKELESKKELEQKLNNLDEKTRFFVEAEILYQKFLDYRKRQNFDEIKVAIEIGKEFLQKYCNEDTTDDFKKNFIEEQKVVIEFVKKQISKLEEKIKPHGY